MRRVKIRDLRRNLSDHLKKLPFIITNRGEDIAIVKKPKQENHFEEEKEKKVALCPHGILPHLCKHRKCRKT